MWSLHAHGHCFLLSFSFFPSLWPLKSQVAPTGEQESVLTKSHMNVRNSWNDVGMLKPAAWIPALDLHPEHMHQCRQKTVDSGLCTETRGSRATAATRKVKRWCGAIAHSCRRASWLLIWCHEPEAQPVSLFSRPLVWSAESGLGYRVE